MADHQSASLVAASVIAAAGSAHWGTVRILNESGGGVLLMGMMVRRTIALLVVVGCDGGRRGGRGGPG